MKREEKASLLLFIYLYITYFLFIYYSFYSFTFLHLLLIYFLPFNSFTSLAFTLCYYKNGIRLQNDNNLEHNSRLLIIFI